MSRTRIVVLAALVAAWAGLLPPNDVLAPPARASGSDTSADEALHKAQEQNQQGNQPTDQPQQPDDNYPYKTQSNDTSGQINDLGQNQMKTQEKPPVGMSPPANGNAMAPPGKPPVNNNAYEPDVACHIKPVGGWFQPVQGVYQDDPVFDKVEYDLSGPSHKNPQLDKIDVNLFSARLPMIVGRYTVLMGVEKYMENGEEVFAGSHDTIVIRYRSDCQNKKKVFFRFRLKDDAGERTLYESKKAEDAYLVGPPNPNGEMKLRQVTLTAHDGVPLESFRMKGISYFLTADLVDLHKKPVGLAVYVGGPLVTTNPVQVQFVPLILSGGTPSEDQWFDYVKSVIELAVASHRFIPDYFPLPPDGLPTWTRPPLDLSGDDLTVGNRDDPNLSDLERAKQEKKRQDLTSSEIASRLGAAGMLANAQRVVAIFKGGPSLGNDYERILGTGSVGDTLSTKVVAIRLGAGKLDKNTGVRQSPYERARLPGAPGGTGKVSSDLVDTVAHELVHTMPDKLWSATRDDRHNMMISCGKDYHNTQDKFAYGERVVIGGDPTERRRADELNTVMGNGTRDEVWITQCTYGHLIPSFEERPDPDLLLVRGVIADDDNKPEARFDDFYDMRGDTNVKPRPIKDWGIVLRDSGGAVLSTIPVDPGFFTEENLDRVAAPLFIRIPEVPGTATLEFVKDGKVLASKPVSLSPPSLAIDSATPDVHMKGNIVHMAWHASSAAGKPVKSSVFYSYNDGKWYNDQLFEGDPTSFDVTIDRNFKKHAIKIVVTDGSRSSEQVMKFQTM